MILWLDSAHSAGENMRRDRVLLERLDAAAPGTGSGEAVLRLFRFSSRSITLGYSQRPERALDLERCRWDGVDWAVRPTGGRAVLHDQEWTYSLAARLDDPDWGGGLESAYGRASRLIHASLVSLGVPAALATASRPRPEAEPGSDAQTGREEAARRVSCFASTARHEIVLEGRKLVGSAQRRTSRALLQQGSVLLGDGHARLADYLALPGPDRERARLTIARGASSAGVFLPADRGLGRWADALEGVLAGSVLRLTRDEGLMLLTAADSGSYAPAAH